MSYRCTKCQSTAEPQIVEGPFGPHWAKRICATCGYQDWPPKPTTEKSRRPSAHKRLVKKSGLDYCELCLIREQAMPAGQSLHGHHIEEYADGGDYDQSNVLVVCERCHAWILCRRTEVRHFVGKEGQHYVERREGPGQPEATRSVGDVEDRGKRREADESSVADGRPARQQHGLFDLGALLDDARNSPEELPF